MKKLIMNFFDYNTNELFDGIITDMPYKNCITNALSENDLNISEFFLKAYRILKKDSFMILFSNFAMSYDIIEFDSQYGVGKYIKVSISLDGIKWETKLLKVDSVRLTSALKVVSDTIEKFPYPILLVKTGYGTNIKYIADKVKKKV